MSDIFRDVDEALQKEKAAKFWKEYGPTLILAAIILVLATAAMTAYRTWDGWRDRQETAKLINAAQEKDMAAALEKAADGTRDGHEAVALMAAAGRYADAKNFTKAAELYGRVADDGKGQADLPDLARILQIRSLMAAGAAPDYKNLAAKLEDIANDDASAFQLLAKLDGALLYGDGLKEYAKAESMLSGFDGDTVPESLKEKAAALKHVYAFEQGSTGASSVGDKK